MTKKEKKELRKILGYAKRQKDYCYKKVDDNPEFKTSEYSKDGKYTNEQMSGYYQGRGEANWAVIHLIEGILKEAPIIKLKND